MARFLEINIGLPEGNGNGQELVLALLAEFGFDGFREEEGRILAYIPAGDFSSEAFESFLGDHELRDKIKSIRTCFLPERNWNESWEKNYSPVQISDHCRVRAPFHPSRPGIPYDLLISPGMSFGTAHHETTRLMLSTMFAYGWQNARVLDFGCGTGVLAILAEKLGARNIIALDHDPRAYQNTCENIVLNHCMNIKAVHGEIGTLREKSFHAILGNIDLNVLLKEMKNLSTRLMNQGIAMLSGFYEKDLEILNTSALEHRLKLHEKQSMNDWMVAVYRKAD